MNKYGAVKTVVDGITFASKREAKYYSDYKLLEKAGEISHLELQPKYVIAHNGRPICTVILDFRFREKDGRLRVIDVKGLDNPLSRLKRRLVEAFFPGTIVELAK